jgi:hypothetical protein
MIQESGNYTLKKMNLILKKFGKSSDTKMRITACEMLFRLTLLTLMFMGIGSLDTKA